MNFLGLPSDFPRGANGFMNNSDNSVAFGFDPVTFRRLVRATGDAHEFVGLAVQQFAEIPAPVAILRHDIDVSPMRALALAQIESEEGAFATYTVLLSGDFYSVFEAETQETLLEIRELGHELGLHFDASRHSIANVEDLEEALQWEASILARLLGFTNPSPIKCFSFHNTSKLTNRFRGERYAGMWNAYSQRLRDDFLYTSDSNGYWIHRSWQDVLDAGAPRIHVLTHPEWWREEPLLPRARVSHEVRRRAERVMSRYDEALEASGRLNLGLTRADE